MIYLYHLKEHNIIRYNIQKDLEHVTPCYREELVDILMERSFTGMNAEYYMLAQITNKKINIKLFTKLGKQIEQHELRPSIISIYYHIYEKLLAIRYLHKNNHQPNIYRHHAAHLPFIKKALKDFGLGKELVASG